MNRKEFLKKSMQIGLGSGALVALTGVGVPAATPEEEAAQIKRDKEFTENWLVDLLNTMDKELDESTQIKLLEGCGHGCYRRHEFKREIARQGKGDLQKLMAAYRKVFGSVEKEGSELHIRFNSREHGCFCPVLKDKRSKLYALHCNCHKGTHEAIFQEALGRPYKARIIESVRRGGEQCHFAIELA
jgi:hypothetical protein